MTLSRKDRGERYLMSVLSRAPLRWRLLLVGLVCAVLTAASGGVGTLSLRQIHGDMRQTNQSIANDITSQHLHVHYLVSLRSLVADIVGAKSAQDLANTSSQLEEIRNERAISIRGKEAAISEAVDGLLRDKRECLNAKQTLASLREASDSAFKEIINLIVTITDDTEFDTVGDIADATDNVKTSIDDMNNLASKAFDTTKAAFSLRFYCQQIDSALKDAILASDPAYISQTSAQITSLLENARLSLDELPDSDSNISIASALDELESSVTRALNKRKQAVQSTGDVARGSLSIEKEYREKASIVLSDIVALATAILDRAEFRFPFALEATTDHIRRDLEQAAGTTDRALQTVKSAFALQSTCNQLLALFYEIDSKSDPALVEYHRTLGCRLQHNAADELAMLPDNTSTSQIATRLNSLTALGERMFDTKLQLLLAESQLERQMNAIRLLMDEADDITLDIAAGMRINAEETLHASSGLVSRWQKTQLILVCVAFAMAITFGFLIAKSVTGQIQKLNEGTRIIGHGNLNHMVDTKTQDEIGDLSRAFDKMTKGLAASMGKLNQEIAHREQAEEELRESEERLRAILDTIQVGIVIIDAETHVIVDANPAALNMIGVSREDIVGHVCHKHICPTELGACPITDLEMTVENTERILLKQCQYEVPVLKTAIPVNLNGQKRLIETFVDISERKQAEEELKKHIVEVSEAKRRLEVLVSSTTEREQRMVDLKQEVNDLLTALGRTPKYQAPEKVAKLKATTFGRLS